MEQLTSILLIVTIFLIFMIIILCVVYFIMKQREKEKLKEDTKTEDTKQNLPSTKVATQYTKQSIYKFMQFDKVEDNMIVQDNGQRYLMVLECEGVNYDLMSNIEKTAVEAGFVQFLNTLRFPIQLYVQTRTLNIGESLQNYNDRLKVIKKDYDKKQEEYIRTMREEALNEEKIALAQREMLRVQNLYEYGQDVINDIQRTSQNKNVLRKRFYIVVPFYSAELVGDLLDEEEKKAMIFSELYTRTESLSNALLNCEVKSKILDSNKLVELLYIAYNRDESDIYSVDKAIRAGFSELYSTAPDVLQRRMQAIDQQIEKEAIKLANESISQARTEKEFELKKKEERFSQVVQEMAESLLKENEKYIGKEVTEKAIEKVKEKGKGGSNYGKKREKETRRTTNV